MALRIANNIAAMNTQRWLGVADAGMKKSLERLSSGYRINRASDDAAGLAISQSFRANIASFKVASRNTSEASSLLQVAEGGMDQIGNMLTRLKELATQAASANVGDTERVKINAEATALTTEIDRIANSTKYGSSDLLDGTFGASKEGTLDAGNKGEGVVNDNIIYDFTTTFTSTTTMTGPISDSVDGKWKFVTTGAQTAGDLVVKIQNSAGTLVETGTVVSKTVTFAELGMTIEFGTVINSTVNDDTVDFYRTGLTNVSAESADAGTYTITDAAGTSITLANSAGTISQTVDVSAGEPASFDQLGISFDVGANYELEDLNGATLSITDTGSAGNTFQIGSENNTNNRISISISGVGTSDLGINAIDLSSASGAQDALDSIDGAVSALAGARGDIGANMNRLSYAAANLSSMIENVQAAESVIRDVDMATEMTDFTKNQILLQAGTAMLSQANMSPQQVLALFG
ncbi:MAG: hypothetical protein J7K15_06590, partial [Deltaproteobacteria bacterium]|nr:hypothetical protein [Deltaproteobacteria bacterium]